MYEKGRCRVGYWAGLSLQVAGRSGLVVARLPAVRDIPGSNRAADKSSWFHEILCDTQLWARAAHWLQCLGRLSLPRRWANVWPIAAYKRNQRSSLQLGLRVGGHLALTDFGPYEHSELSHMAGAVDDSTINIVEVIIIIIIILLLFL